MQLKRKPVTVVLLTVLLVLVGAAYVLWRQQRDIAVFSKQISPIRRPQIPQRPLLQTTSDTNEASTQLLANKFAVVTTFEKIPAVCTDAFQRSFANIANGGHGQEEIRLANPGQPFQASDAWVEGLPFRRLEFAGLGEGSCFIHYQSGGYSYPSFCLAVMDYSKGRAVWVGEARTRASDIDGLRSMLAGSQFSVKSGPSC